jgi:hypothetical protein
MLFASGFVYSQASELVDEDAPRMTASQRLQLYQINLELKARTEAVMKKDPRYTRYLADYRELDRGVRDDSFRSRAAAFNKKYGELQKEWLRRSGIDRRLYNLRLKKIFPHLQLNRAGEIVNMRSTRDLISRLNARDESSIVVPAFFAPLLPGRPDTSFETDDFSDTWSYQDCDQASVTFSALRSFSVFANTSVSEDDCDDVKGARGTVITVPEGVTRVRLEITLNSYRLSTSVVTPLLFSYGNSYAAVGIRVNGWILGSTRRTNYFRHKYIDTVWSVAGGDFADVSESGQVLLRCSFRPLVPGEYRVHVYGRAWATTDGLAASSSSVDVKGLRKVKVTFSSR